MSATEYRNLIRREKFSTALNIVNRNFIFRERIRIVAELCKKMIRLVEDTILKSFFISVKRR